MAHAFPISEPKEFLEAFVRRAYKEFRASPLDAYRIKNTIHQMNVMAERMWEAFIKTDPAKVGHAKSPGDYRKMLVANECEDFQLVWDVDDAHKHVQLKRPNAMVSSAGQSGIVTSGGFGRMAFGHGAFGSTQDEFVIVLDNGEERGVEGVLHNVMKMWERLLP